MKGLLGVVRRQETRGTGPTALPSGVEQPLLLFADSFWAASGRERNITMAVIPTLYFARSGVPGGPVLLNGSSAAPTAIQASQIPVLKVQMVMTDGVIQGTITHNWGLDKSSPTYFDPLIWYVAQNATDGVAGQTWLPMLTFDLTNTNVVLVNKLAGAAATPTGATYLITLINNAAMLASAGRGF